VDLALQVGGVSNLRREIFDHETRGTDRESQGACRQDELIGRKTASRKVTLTLSLKLVLRESVKRRLGR
jgi:hypothetical protein